MSRASRLLAVGFLAALLSPTSSLAQFPSFVVGFNDAPIGSAADSQEMFRTPQTSGTTSAYIVPNDTGVFNQNSAYRASGLQSEGSAALQVSFRWVDSADPNAWLRLTTIDGDLLPNPGLHTQGKVRFKITNRSELFFGEIGLCLGIRETGALVPQLSNGTSSGLIEWVGVDETVNGITAGEDGIVDTVASGDDVQAVPFGTDLVADEIPLGTAVIEPGNNGVIDTVPAGDDAERFGYFMAGKQRRPIPAVTLPPGGSPVSVEFNLVTGDVTVGGVTTPAGITGFTGNGILDPIDNRGTLEHLAITNIVSDPATLIEFAIDELQVEAPVNDPVPAPVVTAPIVAGDTEVTVSGLNATDVSSVQLLIGGVPAGAPVTAGLPAAEITASLPSAALTGQVITATQTAHGVTSPESNPVTVVASPPPYGFSILIDEVGTGSCSPIVSWEMLNATGRNGSFAPLGQLVVPDDGNWQLVDIDLTNSSLIQNSLGGNGAIDPSPVGFFTYDSFWFNISSSIDPARLGPYQVLIDGVEYYDPNGAFIGLVMNAERPDGANEIGGHRGQSVIQDSVADQIDTGSYDGDHANSLTWTFPSDDENLNVGRLMRNATSFGCGPDFTYHIPNETKIMRCRMLFRDIPTQPTLALPVVQAPVVGAQSSVLVDVDPNALSVQLYINGLPHGSPVDPNGASTLQFDSLPTIVGDSISATQTFALGESDLAYPRAAGAPIAPTIFAPVLANATQVPVVDLYTDPMAATTEVRLFADGVLAGTAVGGGDFAVVVTAALPQGTILTATQVVNGVESALSAEVEVGQPPSAPTVNQPLQEGDATVSLSDVNTVATLVTIYSSPIDDPNIITAIGSIDPNGASDVEVPVSPLVGLTLITATASNPSGESGFSDAEEVGSGNGDTLLTLLVRETATTAGLGEDGGTANGIEYLGADTASPGAPQGKPISPSPNWQTIVFDPASDPVTAFAGSTANGTLSSANNMGTIEAVGIAVDANSPGRSIGTYVLYIDNVINVGADGGNDFVIDDFEAATPGTNSYMFRSPSFSGSTAADLNLPIANISQVSAEQGNPGNSVKVSWYWVDSTATRWLRLTTYNASGGRPNPTIDLTKPIQMDVLLLQQLPPNAPTVVGPLLAGDQTVTVTDILPSTSLVRVYANGVEIGSINPQGADTVAVGVPGLVFQNSITATQVATGGESGVSNGLEVGRGNGNLLLTICIRETGDNGPLGSESTTDSGDSFEWVGASAAVDGAPQGKPIAPGPAWQTITFDPATDDITSFLQGDGAITGTAGALEHLAVAVDANAPLRSSGVYRMYIDNVINVGADGGSDFVIQDFDDTILLYTPALFQNPGFSGTTDGDSQDSPDLSSVRPTFGNPGQSLLLTWAFLDTSAQRWQRITTAGVATTPLPIIDITKPVQLDVLLLEPCMAGGDVNRDGLVNANDVDPFLSAVAGPGNPIDPADICADLSGNDYVDMFDVALLQEQFGS